MKGLTYDTANQFIQNEFVKQTENEFSVLSPWNGESIGKSYSASPAQLEQTVKSAHEAFKLWSKTPLKERAEVLQNFRKYLQHNIEEIAHTTSMENGKTHAEAKAGILKGIEVLDFAIAIPNSDMGEKLQVSRGVNCESIRVPLGVVTSITPFNFPMMVPMWTIPIALITGNSMILKPSEQTPLSPNYIAQGLKEAGLPSGVFSILHGGAEVVKNIIAHPQVKAVSFVGSTKIAREVYSLAANQGKRVLALGGAKNHILLMPDAHPEITQKAIRDSFTGCGGQRCMAASVLLAIGDCEKNIQGILNEAKNVQLGENMGAIISERQLNFLNDAIEKAVSEGATLLLDGRTFKKPIQFENGYWIGPTILDNVKPGSFASKIELFGPILSIIRCESISQALEIENNNPYGNACSVFTQTGAIAEEIAQKANAGMIGINIGVPVPREPFSFGGIGDSKFGHGEITGYQSIDFWSDLKKVTSKWQKQTDANWMS